MGTHSAGVCGGGAGGRRKAGLDRRQLVPVQKKKKKKKKNVRVRCYLKQEVQKLTNRKSGGMRQGEHKENSHTARPCLSLPESGARVTVKKKKRGGEFGVKKTQWNRLGGGCQTAGSQAAEGVTRADQAQKKLIKNKNPPKTPPPKSATGDVKRPRHREGQNWKGKPSEEPSTL